MFKKILCFILVLTFTVGLIGCGDFDEMTGGQADGDTGSTTETDSVILRFFEELQKNDVAPYELTEKAKKTLSEKPRCLSAIKAKVSRR